MLVGAIYIEHVLRLTVSLTLAEDNKVSGKKNLMVSLSPHFRLVVIKFDATLKQFKLNIMILLWSEENDYCFTKKKNKKTTTTTKQRTKGWLAFGGL